MKQGFLRYLLLACFCLLYTTSFAERFSYVYIQGDKEIPFYVKLEDEMLTRYGKNYSIISELNPGPINIQILFQQNDYPPQNFVIQVPENGFRGFLLTYKSGAFSLYDIHQQFYLPAGNKAEDDRLPAITSRIKEINTPPPTPKATPTIKKEIKKTPPVVAKKEPTPKKPEVTPPTPKTTPRAVPRPINPPTKENTEKTDEPKFIKNIELQNERTQSTEGTIKKPETTEERVHIINSDCPQAMTAMDFNSISAAAQERIGNDRLKYLLGEMNNCYTTSQAGELVGLLDGDTERYTLLKRIYPRITDQENFPDLKALLTSDEWKKYFNALVK